MAWTDLSSAFTYNSQLTSAQQRALRDNISALANGDSGAPRIQPEALRSYPKSVFQHIETSFDMDTSAENNYYSSTALMYRTSTDRALRCTLSGIPAASLISIPDGYVQVSVYAAYGSLQREAAATAIYAPRTNSIVGIYTLNALDLSEFPTYAFIAVGLKYNPYNPYLSTSYQYHFKTHSATFYMES